MANVAQNPAVEQKAKIDDVAAKVATELNAQANAISGVFKTSGAIGSMGLDQLAIQLGESTNPAGRPTLEAYLPFVLALAASKPSYAAQNRLCQIANKAVKHQKKDGTRVMVAKSKGKGEIGKGACSFRIAAPVAWDLAVGE